MNTVIRTMPQLQQLQNDTWVYGFIFAGIALLIAFIIAQIINWRSDRKDYMTRLIWFIVIGLVEPTAFWLYNTLCVIPIIQNPGFQNMFKGTNLWVLIASIFAYAAIGIISMLIYRDSKWGSILGKKKD